MAKNDGGQAFPSETVLVNGFREVHKGMTRRQWLVGKLAASYRISFPNESSIQIACLAHEDADAILDYEEKEGKDVQEPKLG